MAEHSCIGSFLCPLNKINENSDAIKEKDEAVLIVDQILTRMQADLKHELMHYVQDVFLSKGGAIHRMASIYVYPAKFLKFDGEIKKGVVSWNNGTTPL